MILGLAPVFSGGQDVSRVKPPAGLSPFLAGLYGDPLLTREQEAHLFRKMNFLKHQAARLRSAINPTKAKAADLDRVEALLGAALAVKNQIIRANLRLVVSLVKKRIHPNRDFATHSRPFDPRWLFPAIETDGEETSKATDVSPISSDEESTDDPTGREFDEALEQITSERWCVCPRCGAIVGSDGSVLS